MAGGPLARELVFGGGSALAALHLHHRTSEDVDFFAMREVTATEIGPIVRALAKRGTTCEVEVVGVRTSIVLSKRGGTFGRVDFAYYPYEPVGRRPTWRGLQVESLEDLTVNKVQAVLTRFQPRDFVDLYFLLREGPIRDLDRLLTLARAKFDAAPHRLGLAARLLLARDIASLPPLLRPVDRADLVAFFEERARELARAER